MSEVQGRLERRQAGAPCVGGAVEEPLKTDVTYRGRECSGLGEPTPPTQDLQEKCSGLGGGVEVE